MKITYPKTLWHRWKQGFNSAVVLFLLFIMVAIPYLLIRDHLSLNEPRLVIGIASGLALLVVLIIVIPIITARLKFDSRTVREQCAALLRPHVEKCASRAGLIWTGHYLSEVTELVHAGQISDARNVYFSRAGISWDQAGKDIADWPITCLVKMLEGLDEHLGNAANSLVAD